MRQLENTLKIKGEQFMYTPKGMYFSCLHLYKRKSPIPHFRRAHWHKFWVGEGRNTLKVKWIEPVFVGQGPSSNATIHKIKNN